MAEAESDYAKASKENALQLTQAICDMEGLTGVSDFAVHARGVQDLFNTLRPLPRDDRETLWARYQQAWATHKAHVAHLWAESEELLRELSSKLLYGLDLGPDGRIFGSEAFGRADWEGMAAKLSTAKALLDEVESTIRGDFRLTPKHRHELFQKLHEKRYDLRQARELAWSVLYDRAAELFDEAYYAIDTMPPQEALHVFKENQHLVMALYLSPSDKEKLKGWFQELWSRLQARFEERRHA